MLPGIGGMTATLLTYGFEKQISKHPEKFGERGNRRGCSGRGIQQCQQWGEYGAFDDTWYTGESLPLPCLSGAFLMYGLKPGPLLMETNPEFFWAVVASLYIGNVMLLILNLPLVNIFARLLDVPEALLNGFVIALCALGVFTRKSSLTELFLMIIFGVFGYFTQKHKYPAAPLLLGLVLGDMLEQGFRCSMSISNGDLTVFLHPAHLAGNHDCCRYITGLFVHKVLLAPARECRITKRGGST